MYHGSRGQVRFVVGLTFWQVRWWVLGGALLVAVALAIGLNVPDPDRSAAPEKVAPSPERSKVRWMAVGGGSLPSSNQVSIESDIALAREVFGERGRVYFAGGSGSHGVQVLDRVNRGDRLLRDLATLFSPRDGRGSSYRRTRIAVDGAATSTVVLQALEAALADGTEPLLLYVALHGVPGRSPRDSAVALWGGVEIRVSDLSDRLASARRPVHLVVTACYGGGFADLIFQQADPNLDAARTERCGLFASTWDLPSTGCDPNPDRRRQEGYGLRFLNALRGMDKHGERLDPSTLDLDGDGHVSLIEAHTRVRLMSPTMDVPTTTSERWLRARAPASGPEGDLVLPEEEAVIRHFQTRLGVRGTPDQARKQQKSLQDAIDRAQKHLDNLTLVEDDLYRSVAGEVLARWPVLDDPWHPDFWPTIDRDRKEIGTFLWGSPTYDRFVKQMDSVNAQARVVDALRLQSAPYERVVRAYDTRSMARRLQAAGGPNWDYYQQLRRCEFSRAPR